MSNLENNLNFKPPVKLYQDHERQPDTFSNTYHNNDEQIINVDNSVNQIETQKKTFCSSQIATASTKNLDKSSLFSTHNSADSLTATITYEIDCISVKSSDEENITESSEKVTNHFCSKKSVVESNMNNDFDEPSSSSITISNLCNSSTTSSIISINCNNLNQKQHINSTSATVKDKDIKSEKSDIQTEPDSTTNGLSPDKILTLKTSITNSDTGFGSSSSSNSRSSFCSSNSSNSSCISNESTNCNFKQQKVYKFAKDMDVLVQKKDGKYYLGIIKDVYAVDGKCLINFGDSTDFLADFDELKPLGLDSKIESIPMCVICKKYNKNDVVETCEKCLRGYHRFCTEGGYNNGVWTCKMCFTKNGIKSPEKKSSFTNAQRIKKENGYINFPYDITNLTWDNKHLSNKEEIYCYCGKFGAWNIKMLQCIKCQQWFHEKCLNCLAYPLLFGDRFYVFLCSVCNHGTEMIRRLKFSWVDLVHLILYNITQLGNEKKYHHVTKVITPFAIQNWPNLQLSSSMNSMSPKEIQKKIISVLNNSSRFKNGMETKKGLHYWGLRTLISPSIPKIVIPKGTTKITDQFLKSVLKLKYHSPGKKLKRSALDSEEDLYIDDTDSKLSSDLKFSSEDEIPIKNIIEKEMSRRESIEIKNELSTSLESSHQQHIKQIEQKEQSRRKKKQIFYPRLPNTLTNDTNGISYLNNNINISNNNINEKPVGVSAEMSCCDSSDDNSSLGTLDIRIPPPKNFYGRNNPFRQVTPKKSQDNYNNNKVNSNDKKFLGAVGKLKVNGNNKKKIVNGGNKSIDLSSKLVALKKSSVNLFNCGLQNDFKATQYRIVRTIKRRLSAKDLVIGPNQEVKKRRLRRSSVSNNCEVISTSIQSVSSPKSKNNIIATYLGSSFNYNSISNLNNTQMLNVPTSTTVSSGSTATNTPLSISSTLTDTNINQFSNFPNIQQQQRNLRKRDDKNYAENRRNSISSTNINTINGHGINNGCSIISNETSRNNSFQKSDESELSNLQSSINMYFGVIERIRNGEKYCVRGQRISPKGTKQYLIEWESGEYNNLD